MCNLCSDRMFLVSNPCCCCDLRCGVVWVGILDVVGLTSLYFPSTLRHTAGDLDGNEAAANATVTEREASVAVFDVVVPFTHTAGFKEMQGVGCYFIQAVTGLLIVIGTKVLGSHILVKFLIGCCWLIFRVIIFMFLALFFVNLIKSTDGRLYRYGIYLLFKLLFDVYLFVIVRYYTMECYDLYRYQRAGISAGVIRRLPPADGFSKSAPKQGKIEQEKNLFKNIFAFAVNKTEPATKSRQKSISEVRNLYQKRAMTGSNGLVPVWDRKNEVIFYGEDYSDWDPAVFQARWEMLNEQDESGLKDISKNPHSKFVGLAAALMMTQAGGRVNPNSTEIDNRRARENRSGSYTGGKTVGGSARPQKNDTRPPMKTRKI